MVYEAGLASGATGSPTPAGAVDTWLATSPDGLDGDSGAWHATPADPLSFTDGHGLIVVSRAGAAGGYVVTSASTCLASS